MRIFLILIDGFGVGALPDAKHFGDEGSNTFLHVEEKTNIDLPNLKKLGLYNIVSLDNVGTIGSYGKMAEKSMAKDTTAGHWEIGGSPVEKAFVTFNDGIIPKKLVEKLEEAFGTKTLCNKSASGTEVIKEFGAEHIKTGYPIVYTSADSVVQIACHNSIYPIERLYELCKKARVVCDGEFAVGRVIARPFDTNAEGKFYRTPLRKDYSLFPSKKTLLEKVKQSSKQMIGVGKIEDIFPGNNLTASYHTHTNIEGIKKIKELLTGTEFTDGLMFANLVDTDMLYGHRNDVVGYAGALKEIDKLIEYILQNKLKDDVIIITADHGNDPTTLSTDHSREYTPFIIFGDKIKSNVNFGICNSFQAVGDTVLDLLKIDFGKNTYSVIKEVLI